MSIAIADQIDMPVSKPGTPTWEMALLYPNQGEWSEREYLALDTGTLVEFTDGVLEFLPMPNVIHQRIMIFLCNCLNAFLSETGLGEAVVAPCALRLRSGKFREPDILFVRPEQINPLTHMPESADLVIEIVSQGKEARERDLIVKRQDYAAAGIPEYWIVDPETATVTVLTLDKNEYRTHGEFRPCDSAESVLLDGFTVNVQAVFDAGQPPVK